jgi:ABC-2 type transport system permease protein
MGGFMLWQKSWWETRLIFLVCLIMAFFVFALVFGGSNDAADWTMRLQRSTELSESERQALNNFQAQIWALWFKTMLSFYYPYVAVVIGVMCLRSACTSVPFQAATGLFTFSLPVSRRKVMLSQAAVGIGEMVLLALIPSLFLPIMAQIRGGWFSWRDVLIYSLLTTLGGMVFFCSAFLLMVVIGNRFVVIVLLEAVVFAFLLPFQPFKPRQWWNILGVMAGESYFYHRQIPWFGLLISMTFSAVFIYSAVRIFERRDL